MPIICRSSTFMRSVAHHDYSIESTKKLRSRDYGRETAERREELAIGVVRGRCRSLGNSVAPEASKISPYKAPPMTPSNIPEITRFSLATRLPINKPAHQIIAWNG